MRDLDQLLRGADPADLDPAVTQEATALASYAAAFAASSDRPTRNRRVLSRPALVAAVAGGLVFTGGVAAAAPTLLDFFAADSPVVSTVRFDVPGADASCSVFLNVVPADGTTYTDDSGLDAGGGSAATFDRADFDAVEAFLRSHDWSGVIDQADPFGDTTVEADPDGTVRMQGSYIDISGPVEQVLADNGLNTTKSAILVQTQQCGVGTGS